jgi:hypothetical protein
MQTQILSFEDWSFELLASAHVSGQLQQIEALGDHVLRMFWKDGAEPTVMGIIVAAES